MRGPSELKPHVSDVVMGVTVPLIVYFAFPPLESGIDIVVATIGVLVAVGAAVMGCYTAVRLLRGGRVN